MAMRDDTSLQTQLAFVAAAASGDIGRVAAYFQQPAVLATVAALDAKFPHGQPIHPQPHMTPAADDVDMTAPGPDPRPQPDPEDGFVPRPDGPAEYPGDARAPDPEELDPEDAWYYGEDRSDFVFERVIASHQVEMLQWFFAPPTSVWLENTLLFLFARIARLAVEYDTVAMLELLLQSALFVEHMLAQLRTKVLAQLLDSAICAGNPVMVQVVVAHGADVNGAIDNRWPPIVAAAMHDDRDGAIVELLLQRGADLSEDKDGVALRMATQSGNLETLRTLLRNGADCDARDPDGRTALHTAAKEGLDEVVEVLVNEGYADIDAQDVDGRTPLICGAAEELTASRFDWGDVGSQIRVTDVLLRYGADVQIQDYEHCTALIAAAKNVHIEIMQMLLEHGADPNAQTVDGCTALHFLTGRGRWPAMLDGIELLLAYGGDPEIADVDGDTPHSLLIEDDEGKEWATHLERYLRTPRSRSNSACSSLSVASCELLRKIAGDKREEEVNSTRMTSCAMEEGGWQRDRSETSSIDSADAFASSFDQMEVDMLDAANWAVPPPCACALPSACTV